MNGFLLIDKEKGWISFDVVRKIKRISGEKKVGHSGTLDPLATGLLIVALGEGTKFLEFFLGMDKEYQAEAVFGYESDTYDAEGMIQPVDTSASFSLAELEEVIQNYFSGEIFQIPPKFSAVKVNGKRAYELARKGQKVVLNKRKVKITQMKILEFKWPVVKFNIKCSSGTYIRSLIHDLGQSLKCGAYIKELRRTAIDSFNSKRAVSPEVLINKIEQYLIPIDKIGKEFPNISLTEKEFLGLQDGKGILSNKCEQKYPYVAFYKQKVVGFVENHNGIIKFKKRIWQ